MLGDDPNPTVMTVRVGFGEVSGAREGFAGYAERLGSQARGRQNLAGLGTDNKGKGENATTTNGCKFYENMQMQCA